MRIYFILQWCKSNTGGSSLLYVEQQWCLSLLKSEFFVGVEQQMVFEFVRMMVRNLKFLVGENPKRNGGIGFLKGDQP